MLNLIKEFGNSEEAYRTQFSRDGLEALNKYLTNECEPQKLDIINLCCTYSEYSAEQLEEDGINDEAIVAWFDGSAIVEDSLIDSTGQNRPLLMFYADECEGDNWHYRTQSFLNLYRHLQNLYESDFKNIKFREDIEKFIYEEVDRNTDVEILKQLITEVIAWSTGLNVFIDNLRISTISLGLPPR